MASQYSSPMKPKSNNSHAAVKVRDGRVFCNCDLEARRLLAQTEKNFGRWFYKCPESVGGTQGCRFYQWEDDLVRAEILPPPMAKAVTINLQQDDRPRTPPAHLGLPTPTTPTRSPGASAGLQMTPSGSKHVNGQPSPSRSAMLSPEAKRRRMEQIKLALLEAEADDAPNTPSKTRHHATGHFFSSSQISVKKEDDESERNASRLGSPSKRARVSVKEEEEDVADDFRTMTPRHSQEHNVENGRNQLHTPAASGSSQRVVDLAHPYRSKGKERQIGNNEVEVESNLEQSLSRLEDIVFSLRDAASVAFKAAEDMIRRADQLEAHIDELKENPAGPEEGSLSFSQTKALLDTVHQLQTRNENLENFRDHFENLSKRMPEPRLLSPKQ